MFFCATTRRYKVRHATRCYVVCYEVLRHLLRHDTRRYVIFFVMLRGASTYLGSMLLQAPIIPQPDGNAVYNFKNQCKNIKNIKKKKSHDK